MHGMFARSSDYSQEIHISSLLLLCLIFFVPNKLAAIWPTSFLLPSTNHSLYVVTLLFFLIVVLNFYGSFLHIHLCVFSYMYVFCLHSITGCCCFGWVSFSFFSFVTGLQFLEMLVTDKTPVSQATNANKRYHLFSHMKIFWINWVKGGWTRWKN